MLDGIDLAILLWLLGGVVSGVAELLTGTFFLLPFAVGALAAAAATALGAPIPVVLAVFAGFSGATLFWAVRYGKRIRSAPPATHEGANRYVDAGGVVTRTIEGRNAGRVRIGAETWRALSTDGATITEGTHVRVAEVRGNALVVVPDSAQDS
ncbi:MAG: NfeD family protein [Acidimicrobiia bacterium]|nr:NfeD family protein [Acidimicrobiia bacterium]